MDGRSISPALIDSFKVWSLFKKKDFPQLAFFKSAIYIYQQSTKQFFDTLYLIKLEF
jgi:hypothetical protein